MEANESITNLTGVWANVTDPSDGAESVQCGLFFFIIYGPLYGLVCFLGLVGNSLSFAVLHRFGRRNVATYLLKALAVTDNLFLLVASFINIYPAMSLYFGLQEQIRPIYPYIQMIAWPITHIIQMVSVWMMVVVATNRYIAVCKPLHAPRLCTKRNVQIQMCIMTVAIVLYNIPRFFEIKYVYINGTSTDNVTSPSGPQEVNVGLQSIHLYNILYENVSYMLFVFLIPLLILIVLNAHLVLELKKARKSREALSNRSSNEENNITLVMIVIIIVFIVCQLPAAINQILFYIMDERVRTYCSHYMKYFHICNLLITTNSSVNFIIYCVFRRQFQQDLWALLCCRDKRTIRRSTLLRLQSGSYRDPSVNATETTVLESVPLKNHLQDGNRNHHGNHVNHFHRTCS